MAYASVPRSARCLRRGEHTYVKRDQVRTRDARTRMEWDDYYNFDAPAHLLVYECDTDPEPTGLLDEYGDPIYRFFERRPIGFIHGGE